MAVYTGQMNSIDFSAQGLLRYKYLQGSGASYSIIYCLASKECFGHRVFATHVKTYQRSELFLFSCQGGEAHNRAVCNAVHYMCLKTAHQYSIGSKKDVNLCMSINQHYKNTFPLKISTSTNISSSNTLSK